MRNRGSQDAFSERLARIEKSHSTGNTHLAMNQHGLRDMSPVDRQKKLTRKSRNPMTRLLIFALLFMGGSLFALSYLQPNIVGSQIALMRAKIPSASDLGIPTTIGLTSNRGQQQTAGSVAMSRTGNIYRMPAVANAAGATLLASEVSANGVPPSFDPQIPTSIVPPIKACDLHTPVENEKIYSVSLDQGEVAAPIELFSDAAVAKRLNDWFKNGGVLKSRSMASYMDIGATEIVDVFVTDTAQPVHLILQVSLGNTIWRVNTADGVELSEITVITPRATGIIANQETKLTVVDVQYRTAETAGPDDILTREGVDGEAICSNIPTRRPNATWEQWQKAEKNNTLYVNQRESYFKRFAEYNAWFKTRYGQNADDNLIEAETASMFLVGPTPTSPLTFNEPTDADLRIVDIDHMLRGSSEELAQQKAEVFANLLEQAAGGSIESLNPIPVERSVE